MKIMKTIEISGEDLKLAAEQLPGMCARMTDNLFREYVVKGDNSDAMPGVMEICTELSIVHRAVANLWKTYADMEVGGQVNDAWGSFRSDVSPELYAWVKDGLEDLLTIPAEHMAPAAGVDMETYARVLNTARSVAMMCAAALHKVGGKHGTH